MEPYQKVGLHHGRAYHAVSTTFDRNVVSTGYGIGFSWQNDRAYAVGCVAHPTPRKTYLGSSPGCVMVVECQWPPVHINDAQDGSTRVGPCLSAKTFYVYAYVRKSPTRKKS